MKQLKKNPNDRPGRGLLFSQKDKDTIFEPGKIQLPNEPLTEPLVFTFGSERIEIPAGSVMENPPYMYLKGTMGNRKYGKFFHLIGRWAVSTDFEDQNEPTTQQASKRTQAQDAACDHNPQPTRSGQDNSGNAV